MSDTNNSDSDDEPVPPKDVLYCGACGFPPEYCRWSPNSMFESQCRPWLIQNYSKVYELYPEWKPVETNDASEGAESTSNDVDNDNGRSDSNKNSSSRADDSAAGENGEEDEKKKKKKKSSGSSKKDKKKAEKEVVIEKGVRNKKKCITTVKGLDLFGIKLSEASKKLGKKFACGSSVIKDASNKEQIDIQGDYLYEMPEFLLKTYQEALSGDVDIILVEDKQRRKFKR